MSVNYLRETAAMIRDEWGDDGPRPMGTAWHRERDFHLAVADWIDTAGADIWAHGPLCECGTGCDACDDNLWEPHARHALAVARAWRGDT